MQFDYKYDLPKEEAKSRLEILGEYLSNRHGILVTWNGDKAHFSGKYLVVKVDGELTLNEGMVHFNGKDPGMLWRKKAIEYLQGKLAAYLHPGTPIEQLPRDK
jgi:hypothetical protein